MEHHHHHHEPAPVDPATARKLTFAVVPFIAATLIGMIVLWPSSASLEAPGGSTLATTRYTAEVIQVDREPCDQAGQEGFDCAVVSAELAEGPDQGETVLLNVAESPSGRRIQEGDNILLGRAEEGVPGQQYYFQDFERSGALVVLVLLFAVVVIALSRWRGVTSLIGLAASLVILLYFVLPAILDGSSPVIVSLVGGAAIMFVTLYLAHGFNAMTTTALLGTLCSLAITGILAVVFVEAVRFTGFGSEEATFLQFAAQQVNLQGLLLGGIVIGTLGVLDDVTVTQASAVWELHRASPDLGAAGLYKAGVRIGRDHIASTVNTLVLAYAGASLPLLILFSLSNASFVAVVTSEVVAEEVVRTLVGSIGLVASVPLTTALAAVVASGEKGTALIRRREPREKFRRPRGEDFFRSDEEPS